MWPGKKVDYANIVNELAGIHHTEIYSVSPSYRTPGKPEIYTHFLVYFACTNSYHIMDYPDFMLEEVQRQLEKEQRDFQGWLCENELVGG